MLQLKNLLPINDGNIMPLPTFERIPLKAGLAAGVAYCVGKCSETSPLYGYKFVR